MEILLAIFYISVFAYLIIKLPFFSGNGLSKGFTLFVFFIKAGAGIGLSLLYVYYYDSADADTYRYFRDGQILYSSLWDHPADFFRMVSGFNSDAPGLNIYYDEMGFWWKQWGFGLPNDNRTVIRINALLMIFSFGKYYVHVIFWSFMSLVGLVAIYKTFYSLSSIPGKLMLFSFFLIPSVVFWSSGVLKEGILIFGMGLFLYCLKALLRKKNSVYAVIGVVLSGFLLLSIKSYTVFLLCPAAAFYLWAAASGYRGLWLRLAVIYGIFLISIFQVYRVFPYYDLSNLISIKRRDVIKLALRENAGSIIDTAKIAPSVQEIIKQSPVSFFNTMFRPGVHEARSATALLAAVENSMLVFILLAVVFFFRIPHKEQLAMVAGIFSFTITLFILVGLTTPVMGAAVRYKMPALPLFYFALFHLLDYEKLIRKLHLNRFNFSFLKKSAFTKFILFISVCACFTSCMKTNVDLIVHHAAVYCTDTSFSIEEAFAVKNGLIAGVGSDKEIFKEFSSDVTIDAEGLPVYPGFIDAHCHFYDYGLNQRWINLTGTASFKEIIYLLGKSGKKHMRYGWIAGNGWDQNDWTVKKFPDNKILDSLFPDIPVFLKRIDGHAALVNSKALQIATIDAYSKIDGGFIETENGTLTGILIDNAVDAVESKIPEPDLVEKITALLYAQRQCFSSGLTTVDDAGLDLEIIDLIDTLQKSGLLKIRIYAMANPTEDNFTRFLGHPPYKTDRLSVRSFKFYADGALGSHGALLLKPYSDKTDEFGIRLTAWEKLAEFAKAMHTSGFQMNTHCIGDSACREIADIYGKTLQGKKDMRWRIEHAQVVDTSDLQKFRNYGIIPSVQPTHAISDMAWAADRLGPERIKDAYAYANLLKEAGMLALGTDFPVESINPVFTFYSAVARKNISGLPPHGFQPENALSREHALKGMTSWAAYANFEESVKGSLETGKVADFVILDKDIMKVPESEIPAAKVLQTYIGGEKVFGIHY